MKPTDRRSFLRQAAALACTAPVTAAATLAAAEPCLGSEPRRDGESPSAPASLREPFWGEHQGGIATPMQSYSYFVALDLTATKREEVITLLQAWTTAAARLTSGVTAADAAQEPGAAPLDSGETLGLGPCRLTITFGFGGGLFQKDGSDRYGLAKQRPDALADLPRFVGDKLVSERSGGDLSVQACADDPQVAAHAIRQLVRLAYAVATVRWAQTGFVPSRVAERAGHSSGQATPRNLMGFKDGTRNIRTDDHAAMKYFVWAGAEAPAWMQGGSYMVIRPVRIALEHWDRMNLAFQEQTVGRRKLSGAPLSLSAEHAELPLNAVDAEGNPVIAENAHIRLAAPQRSGGARILRRAYSYDNGVSFTTERWPPWHQGMEFDAGLLFQCYQRDPRRGFTRIFTEMAKFDMLNQFTTHVGSGLFACPRGALVGEYIGERLFTGEG